MSRQPLAPAALRRALAVRDLTDAALGPHAIQLLVRDAIAALRDAWDVPVVVRPCEPVVDVADNYDRLGYAPEAAARDARYSRYVDDGRMLRAPHVRARSPAPCATWARRPRRRPRRLPRPRLPPRRHRPPARRRAAPARPLARAARRARRGDLERMVALVVAALLPGRAHRCRPAPTPTPSTAWRSRSRPTARGSSSASAAWRHPRPAPAAASTPGRTPGWRWAWASTGRSCCARASRTSACCAAPTRASPASCSTSSPTAPSPRCRPCAATSRWPSRADVDAELLGDRAREALGADAEAVEQIAILARTPARDLPPAAIERLGLRPGRSTCSSGSSCATPPRRSRPLRQTDCATSSTPRCTRASATNGPPRDLHTFA